MSKPYRDPKYSGWPGPEPVQTDIEETIAEITPHGEPYQPPEPKPRPRKKTAGTGAGAGE
jgi:hypothetical protein